MQFTLQTSLVKLSKFANATMISVDSNPSPPLPFQEPFSGAKEMLAEQAQSALKGAAESMLDAYSNATRAKLDVRMDAPIIIVPVHSLSTR